MISTRFCSICGAANDEIRADCFACGQLLPIQFDEHIASPEMLLNGRYRLGATLGSGGYSAVSRAWDTRQGEREVAIKQINLRGLSAEETIEATSTYNREVEVLATLNHSQIPRLYEHFADHDHWYLVLEYIKGQTLENFLSTREAQSKPLSLAEILAFALQLCAVLEYLHTRQPPIIFRDLKPSNIMRTPAGKLYLIDFGIARHYTPGQGRDTQPLGSPGYAAPEQYGRAQTDIRADIYSLGVLLHQLLTGHDPSSRLPGLLPSRLNGQAGNADLESLVTRMLASDSRNRPPGVSELADELERVRQLSVRRDGSIWQPPTPQDYTPATATAAFAGAQVYLQHATFAQPALGAALKATALTQSTLGAAPPAARASAQRRKQLSRRRVLIGLGAGATALLATGIGVKIWQGSPQTGQMLYTYRGHTAMVNGVAWSQDSQRVASASTDQSLQIWDALSGDHLISDEDYQGAVTSVASMVNGNTVAGSADTTVQVWDATGYMFFEGKHDGVVNSVASFPNGRSVASASADGTVRVWDTILHTSTVHQSTNNAAYLAMAVSPDASHIAAATSGATSVEIWNANFPGNSDTSTYYGGPTNVVLCMAWSPDGTSLAAGSADATVFIWDATSGMPLTTFSIPTGSVLALSWSPDSKRLASASDDGIVRIWSTDDGSILFTYTGHNGPVSAVAWSPDGRSIASAGADMTVQIWSAP
jgi:eukaryotic-like serine/threonine-protein kinase